jgi:menaquinone-dependent protoporphyrinogen IX oxidase
LIATQGSDFKNAVTKGLVDHFKSDSIFIQVVDIQELSAIDPVNYDALVLIHTWESWKPPVEVKSFIERTKKY